MKMIMRTYLTADSASFGDGWFMSRNHKEMLNSLYHACFSFGYPVSLSNSGISKGENYASLSWSLSEKWSQ
jgi:hypothetical protein